MWCTDGGGIVFDNWRVLHGRNSFKGIRRICGGYSKWLLPGGMS
jgi:hypothetical protein